MDPLYSVSFDRFLLETSTAGLASLLALEVLRFGVQRSVVSRLSLDGNALVREAFAGLAIEGQQSSRLALKFFPTVAITLAEGVGRVHHMTGAESPERWESWLGFKSGTAWLEMPILAEEQRIGVAFFQFEHQPGRDYRDYLGLFGRLLVTYGRYYRVLKEQEDSRALLKANEILRKVDQHLCKQVQSAAPGRSSPSLDHGMQTLADFVVRATEATASSISLLRGDQYKPVATGGTIGKMDRAVRDNDPAASGSITLECIQKRAFVIRTGNRDDPFFRTMSAALEDPEERRILKEQRAWGAVPIISDGEVLGGLSIVSSDWDFFVPWRKVIVEAFADKINLLLHVNSLLADIYREYQENSKRTGDLNARLRDATQEISVGETARIMVHNLANLLQPLGSDVGRIRDWVRRHPNARFPEALMKDLDQGLTRIEDAFEFYRKLRTSTNLRSYHSLSRLIEDAVEFAKPRLEEASILSELRPVPGNPEVLCSDVEMIHAFLNIILNAMHSMMGRSASRRLVIRVTVQNDKAAVRFEDTGRGIKASQLARIWDFGFTTKRDHGGSGLGLPYVKTVVQRSGGTAKIESAEGRGTTVTITLPIRREE